MVGRTVDTAVKSRALRKMELIMARKASQKADPLPFRFGAGCSGCTSGSAMFWRVVDEVLRGMLSDVGDDAGMALGAEGLYMHAHRSGSKHALLQHFFDKILSC